MFITLKKTRTWCSPDDLKEEQRCSFQPYEANNKGIYDSSPLHTPTLPEDDIKSIYQKAMILSIRQEMVKICEYISLSFVVFLTDENGNILDLVCSSLDMQEDMNKAGLGAGVSLSKLYSGLNAVSLAMEMNCIGVVRGEEHSDSTFKDWNCVCAPLQLDGIVRGYVDISFNRGQQIEFAIPFIKQIAENVTQKWMNRNSEIQQSRLEVSFHEYKLTAREKDVAHLWIQEKSALHISSMLGISEGTVRNVVKSIYTKMNVNERRQFAKKLVQ
ncbi:LuxR C-terminal-related transcriptional regulator [Paenibacillus wynnii]|uniref:LuxR C-terminal-related transcriptional regulator n=1 Tax=Paenibacillus wynnii TaxID=268407 RepID=UPI0027903170|nr:LuxR C-terminal-related transcriptional regulator [Paenibacillus wynnii]MDQ0192126.1 transcriptional regulator of acetoin/glycerol metabolism [Paenibacillus wynnii]